MSDSVKNQNLYTTGELAKLCGVSVRTVQYYDTRGILTPSALSEGGRRLYSEEDAGRMRIICFLRDAGISINGIGALFTEEHPEKVIALLLEQQESALREEIAEGQRKLGIVEGIKRELKSFSAFSVGSIGDIAHMMKQKNKLKRMRLMMIFTGIPVTALQWVWVILWITHGYWWLFSVYLLAAIPWGIWASVYYFKRVAYICPECHEVFRPRLKEAFWAYHTPKMRRLTCPHCGHKGMCVEIYAEDVK